MEGGFALMGTMGSVTADFTADTRSADAAISELGAAYRKAGENAEAMAAKIKAAGGVSDRTADLMARSIEKYRASFQRELTEQSHAQYAAEQLARAHEMTALKADILARAVDGTASSVSRLSQEMESSVPKTAAASAAIRVMEGNLGNNIRAAERFVGSMPGLSSVLEGAFPVIGAVALLGVVSELIGRVAKFSSDAEELASQLNIGWLDGAIGQLDGLKEAAEEADGQLANLARDADTLKTHSREMQIEVIRKTQGPAAAFRAQASDKDDYVASQEKMLADIRSARSKALSQLDPHAPHTSDSPLLATTSDQEKAKLAIKEMDAQVANIQRYIDAAKQEAGGFRLDAGAEDKKKAEEAAKRAAEAYRRQQAAQREATRLFVDEAIADYKRLEAGSHEVTESITEEWVRGQRADEEAAKKVAEAERQHAREYLEQQRAMQQAAVERLKGERIAAKDAYQSAGETSSLRVDLGQMSPAARTKSLQDALQRERSLELDSFNKELELYAEGSAEYQKVLNERTKADEEYYKQLAELQKQSVEEGWSAPLLDMARQWTNWQSVFKQSLDTTLSGVNGELVRMMTTQYRRGDWKNATKPIFTGLATSGLQGAEGSLMKMIPGLGGLGKMGTRGNPMFVQDVGGVASGAVGLGAALTQAGGATSSSGAVGGFLGILGSAAKFLGFMADGGTMDPGGFYLTGERGPELLQVGSTSRINNAKDTAGIMGGGGSRDTHVHIGSISSNDPAAVRQAVMDGIAKAAPHIAAGTLAADRDMRSRRPSGGY
jgi:hypothetical protein